MPEVAVLGAVAAHEPDGIAYTDEKAVRLPEIVPRSTSTEVVLKRVEPLMSLTVPTGAGMFNVPSVANETLEAGVPERNTRPAPLFARSIAVVAPVVAVAAKNAWLDIAIVPVALVPAFTPTVVIVTVTELPDVARRVPTLLSEKLPTVIAEVELVDAVVTLMVTEVEPVPSETVPITVPVPPVVTGGVEAKVALFERVNVIEPTARSVVVLPEMRIAVAGIVTVDAADVPVKFSVA